MHSALPVEKPHCFLCRRIGTLPSLTWQIAWICIWLLPNLVLRIAARDVYTPSGLVNLDLLLCGATALYIRSAWSPVLLDLCMAIDVAEGITRTWFFGLQDIFQAAELLPSLPPHRLCGYAALVMGVFGSLGWAAWLVRRHTSPDIRFRTGFPLLLLLFLSLTVDITWGRRSFSNTRDAQSNFFLARSPEHSLYRQIHAVFQLSGRPARSAPIESASSHLLGEIPSLQVARGLDVVQILVESWGTDRDGRIDRQLLALYSVPEMRERYRIVTGTVPFDGPTIFGETRELCNSTLGFGVLRPSSSPLLANCLPQQFKAAGYRTEAVHGYFGGLYGRYLWYPRVGFDSSYFERRLHSEGLTDCQGAFPGICDAQAAQWIGDHLAHTPVPLFVHWMTLNSHLPVPSRLVGLNPVSCDFDPLVRQNEPLCAWFKLAYQVHSSIAGLALRNDIPPTAFVIVGDHAPPFASSDLRNRFSVNRVPYLLLIPGCFAQANRQLLTATGASQACRECGTPDSAHGSKSHAGPRPDLQNQHPSKVSGF